MKYENRKIGRFNLLEENVCDLSCRCGWNIKIGGGNYEDLDKIKEFLLSLSDEDKIEKEETVKMGGYFPPRVGGEYFEFDLGIKKHPKPLRKIEKLDLDFLKDTYGHATISSVEDTFNQLIDAVEELRKLTTKTK